MNVILIFVLFISLVSVIHASDGSIEPDEELSDQELPIAYPVTPPTSPSFITSNIYEENISGNDGFIINAIQETLEDPDTTIEKVTAILTKLLEAHQEIENNQAHYSPELLNFITQAQNAALFTTCSIQAEPEDEVLSQ